MKFHGEVLIARPQESLLSRFHYLCNNKFLRAIGVKIDRIMKPLQRINLMAEISAYLKKQYSWNEINTYLLYYYEDDGTQLYRWQDYDEYLMNHLRKMTDDKIISIAEELGMQQLAEDDFAEEAVDASFWKLGFYKLFISHIHTDKVSANNLKTVLNKWGVHGFVAHEDIRPSKLWQAEIEKALSTMDCLCAIIVENFYKSKWCDQEVGVAIGRKTPIIPIKKEHCRMVLSASIRQLMRAITQKMLPIVLLLLFAQIKMQNLNTLKYWWACC